MLRLRQSRRLLSSVSLDRLVPGAGQEIAQDTAVVLLILDHQYPSRHAVSLCASTRTGKLKQKVEPFPAAASTQMRPPCISTMRLAMESPNPVPLFFRALELSAWRNASKIFS